MREWLAKRKLSAEEDAEQQRRLRERGMAGDRHSINGDGTSATNERVREVMGEHLEKKYRRACGVHPSDLIDTGALLAFNGRRMSPGTRACVAAYDSIALPLVTTTAVLTETVLFRRSSGSGIGSAAWEFIRSGRVAIAPDHATLTCLASKP